MKRKPNKWTYEALKKSAFKYSSVKQWRTKESSAYATAAARGLLKELTKGMKKLLDHKKWTKKNILNSAIKYSSKKDWAKNENSAYNKAIKMNWLDEATKHMMPLGNKYKRCIYSISVKGTKLVYVGLTGNKIRRKRDHLKSPRFKKLKKIYGARSIIFKQLTDYIDVEKAIRLERKFESDYKNRGFNLLNISRPGVIGGTTIKWTKKNIIKTSKNYKLLNSWRKDNPGAYNAAIKMNILNEVAGHMKRMHTKGIWPEKEVMKSAKKHSIKEEWRKEYPGAYSAAQILGIYKKVTKHMKVISPRGQWTPEAIIKNAKKFKTKGEWRKKFGGAYSAAFDRGVFEQATKHMVDGRSK